jgi:NitT/TauT family transport system permease protein
MVSPLSGTPSAIVSLGVGDRPVIFLIAIAAKWSIVANVAAGVAALDPRWRIVA